MRRFLTSSAILTLAVLGLTTIAVPSTVAAQIINYGPSKGRPGLPVNIVGSGFNELTNIKVRFGQVSASDTMTRNDQLIQAHVPVVADGNYALVLYADQLPSIGLLAGPFRVGPEPDEITITDIYPGEFDKSVSQELSLFGYNFLQLSLIEIPLEFRIRDPHTGTIVTRTATGTVVSDTLISAPTPIIIEPEILNPIIINPLILSPIILNPVVVSPVIIEATGS